MNQVYQIIFTVEGVIAILGSIIAYKISSRVPPLFVFPSIKKIYFSDRYNITTNCNNCQKFLYLFVKKGINVENLIDGCFVCPRCGCYSQINDVKKTKKSYHCDSRNFGKYSA